MRNLLKYLQKLYLWRLSWRNHHNSLKLLLFVLDCTPLARCWCIEIYWTDIIWYFHTRVGFDWEYMCFFVLWELHSRNLCFIWWSVCSRLSRPVSSYFINININESIIAYMISKAKATILGRFGPKFKELLITFYLIDAVDDCSRIVRDMHEIIQLDEINSQYQHSV